MARILVVDDEPPIITLLRRQLSGLHEVIGAPSAEAGLALLSESPADVVITDLRLPGMDGLELARRARKKWPDLPLVGTSGDAALPELSELMRLGIVDFLVKPFSSDEARLAVTRALALTSLARAAADSESPAGERPIEGLLGGGALMTALRASAEQAAASVASLLVEGPSGSGKTLLARAIQAASARADEPFVEVACAALPESLLEGELFGHARGAFTGAPRDRPGVFERARAGTILLDEITALSPSAQSRLVRAVATREVTRLGEDRPRPVEARIIVTSQRALEPLVAAGTFSAELFHALAVLRLRMPSLCELPPGDRGLLARAALSRAAQRCGRPEPELHESFLEAASRLPWPGNVRELENALERAVLLGDGGPVTDADLVGVAAEATSRRAVLLPERGLDLGATLSAIESELIARALQRTGGNRERAAALLGLTRTGLVQKLKRMDETAP